MVSYRSSCQLLFGFDVDESFGKLGKSGVCRFLFVKRRLQKPFRKAQLVANEKGTRAFRSYCVQVEWLSSR